MNRKECERVIFNKMLEIVEVLKKYDPSAERSTALPLKMRRGRTRRAGP